MLTFSTPERKSKPVEMRTATDCNRFVNKWCVKKEKQNTIATRKNAILIVWFMNSIRWISARYSEECLERKDQAERSIWALHAQGCNGYHLGRSLRTTKLAQTIESRKVINQYWKISPHKRHKGLGRNEIKTGTHFSPFVFVRRKNIAKIGERASNFMENINNNLCITTKRD